MATLTPRIGPAEARSILWNSGELRWLLHPGQESLYDSYFNCKEKIVTWNCSRRFGKSWTLCVLAIETCLKKPNSLVKYCCAKQVDAKNIIRPLIREIIQSCPDELKPDFKAYEKSYVFPNGSRIELSGLDAGKAESLRGGAAHLAIIDEAGLIDDLKYIIRSVILPTTTTTKGKIILASTPPKSADHPFIYFLNKSRAEGNLITKTVYDNPNIDSEELEKILDEYGGVDSNDFKREFLCEIITDEERSVVPEFNKELRAKVIIPWKKPAFYDAYVSMDLGLKDLTVALFAYYDFLNDKVVIEDEFVINGQKFTTKALAEGIRIKESTSFSDAFTGETKIPYMRVSDNNLIVIQDLYKLHGLLFFPTKKDDSDAALNNMRMMLAAERVIINPKCKNLIQHLETATWNKAKTSFDRSSDSGHFDAVDALKYLIRNIQFTKNPYPKNFNLPSESNRFGRTKELSKELQAFNKILNIRPKK